MAEYIIQEETLTNIADKVRILSGTTNAMNPEAMANHVGDANTEIESQTDLIAQITTALEGKASGGREQATPIIDVNSSGLITATAGTKFSTYQLAFQAAKTITPGTVDQTAVQGGYYTGGDITVKGDSNLVAENIKSGISIFGVNGTLEEGSGSGSGELVDYSENEDALIARTLTSYTNDRIKRIGSYAFCSCSSLTSISFPECTTIDDHAFYSCTSLTSMSFPKCKTIGNEAFYFCLSLISANFPACTSIGHSVFNYCRSLTSVNFPECTTIGQSAFYSCSSLTSINFPICRYIEANAFDHCSSLTSVNFPACIRISNKAFYYCVNLASVNLPFCTSITGSRIFSYCRTLSSLVLGASTVCTLSHSDAFYSTPYAGYSSYFSGTPYIYVPASLIDAYKSATNWIYFSSYFSTIESLSIPLIAFTIDGTEYQAEEGMTWAEWLSSEYNTDAYLEGDPSIYNNDLDQIIDEVTMSDFIESGRDYTLVPDPIAIG